MQQFTYQGRDKQGKLVTGVVESYTLESASELLKRDGITPIMIELKAVEQDVFAMLSRYLHINIGGPSLLDLNLFARQMHSLLKAGVPIVRAIKVVNATVNNKKLKKALDSIINKLESGQGLALCMKNHTDEFPGLMVSLVNVGENTGNLDEVFRQVAGHLEREYQTRRAIKAATRYPMMVIITIFVAIGIVNWFVIPAFKQFFSKFGAELPWQTKLLITASDFTVNYWYLILFGMAVASMGWIVFLRTPVGRATWDRWKIKLPLVGSIINRALLARFARSFALTSRTGVPLLEAIFIISKTTDNIYVGQQILTMRQKIERGESLSVSATSCGMFSPLVLQMISIGEETGDIDGLLDEVADFYEQELDYDLKKLSAAIEPIMIGIVAGMVLVLALGVFLPMWDIAKVAIN